MSINFGTKNKLYLNLANRLGQQSIILVSRQITRALKIT